MTHTDDALDMRDLNTHQRWHIADVITYAIGAELSDVDGLTDRIRGGEWLAIDEVAGDADQMDDLANHLRHVWPDAAAYLEQLAAQTRTDPGWVGADRAVDESVWADA